MRKNQQRTQISLADTWTAITIPVGATDFILSMEDDTVTFRVSVDNSISASSAGLFIDLTGFYSHEGTNTALLTLYVSASAATFAILQYN